MQQAAEARTARFVMVVERYQIRKHYKGKRNHEMTTQTGRCGRLWLVVEWMRYSEGLRRRGEVGRVIMLRTTMMDVIAPGKRGDLIRLGKTHNSRQRETVALETGPVPQRRGSPCHKVEKDEKAGHGHEGGRSTATRRDGSWHDRKHGAT
jgi:hypothetical protein